MDELIFNTFLSSSLINFVIRINFNFMQFINNGNFCDVKDLNPSKIKTWVNSVLSGSM